MSRSAVICRFGPSKASGMFVRISCGSRSAKMGLLFCLRIMLRGFRKTKPNLLMTVSVRARLRVSFFIWSALRMLVSAALSNAVSNLKN